MAPGRLATPRRAVTFAHRAGTLEPVQAPVRRPRRIRQRTGPRFRREPGLQNRRPIHTARTPFWEAGRALVSLSATTLVRTPPPMPIGEPPTSLPPIRSTRISIRSKSMSESSLASASCARMRRSRSLSAASALHAVPFARLASLPVGRRRAGLATFSQRSERAARPATSTRPGRLSAARPEARVRAQSAQPGAPVRCRYGDASTQKAICRRSSSSCAGAIRVPGAP